MKMTFTFTDTPELSAITRDDRLATHFKFPDEALQLPDCKERVLAIANLVGKLTWACLHVTCREIGLKDYPVKHSKTGNNSLLISAWHPMMLRFDQVADQTMQQRPPPHFGLKIIANVDVEPIPNHYQINPTLVLRPSAIPVAEEQKELAATLNLIGDHCVYLLNTNPDPNIRWQYSYVYTHYDDYAAAKRIQKRARQQRAEKRRREKVAEKATNSGNVDNQPVAPSPKTGAGRRVGAVPGVFRGVQFRSQLEIRFATQLESRHIQWIYESERLGEGQYLVDFHLPDLKCWVEVKGKIEPRDDYLLKEVAGYLARERNERLFVYSQGKAWAVGEGDFREMSHTEFWVRMKES